MKLYLNRFSFLILFALFFNKIGAQIVYNDICEDAITLTPVTMVAGNQSFHCHAADLSVANPDTDLLNGICGSDTSEVVWYKVVTDIYATRILVNIVCDSFTPYYTIFDPNGVGCDSLTQIDSCIIGEDNDLYSGFDVEPNSTYYIIVGVADGTPGLMEICLTSPINYETCVGAQHLTVTRPENPDKDPEGPFCPGERVSFCYEVFYKPDDEDCQYLQGIVPVLGDGWDLDALSIYSQVNLGENWKWYPQGQHGYNTSNPFVSTAMNGDRLKMFYILEPEFDEDSILTTNAPLPAGFYAYTPSEDCVDNGDPDNGLGDPFSCDTMYHRQICFDLIVKDDTNNCAVHDSINDLSLTLFTLSDGEVGCYPSVKCGVDRPLIRDFELNCTVLSVVDIGDYDSEVCLKAFLDIPLSSTDTTAVFYWMSDDPYGLGGTNGTGDTISDFLVNNGSFPRDIKYTIWSINDSGCKGPDKEITITVFPNLTAGFGLYEAICEGDSIEIKPYILDSLRVITHYSWSGLSDTTETVMVAPSETSEYTVTVTDENGCTTTASTVIEVKRNPKIYLEMNRTFSCQDRETGGNIIARAYTDSIELVDYIEWHTSPTGLVFSTASNSFENDIFVIDEEASQAREYTITARLFKQNGCHKEVSKTINIYSPIEISIQNDRPVCLGDSIILTPEITGGTGIYEEFNWSNGDNTQEILLFPSANMPLTFEVEDSRGCHGEDSTIVVINAGALFNLDPSMTTICRGSMEDTMSIVLEILLGFPDFDIQWTTDGDLIYTMESKQYTRDSLIIDHFQSSLGQHHITAQVSDFYGCVSEQEIWINVIQESFADFDYEINEQECSFSYIGYPADDFMWDFGDGNTSELKDPTHFYEKGGSYDVTLTINDTCGVDQVTKTIYIVVSDVSEEDESNFIHIYPNPVEDYLKLEFGERYIGENTFIRIMDIHSKKMMERSERVRQPVMDLDLSSYPSGIYIISVFAGEKQISRKILKQ